MQNLIIKRILTLLFCLVFFILGQAAKADDWYVSNSGAGGMDGTSAADAWAGWSNIQWASIVPGDTLYVIGVIRGGTGFTTPSTLVGTDEDRITIAGYPSDPGVLYEGIEYGDSGWTGGSFSTYNRIVSNCNYSRVHEWTGDPLTYVNLIKEDTAPDGTWAAGSFYCDGGSNTLHYRPSDGTLDSKNLTVKWSSIASLSDNGSDYVTYRNLTFTHGIRVGSSGSSNYLTFDSCTIRGYNDINGISVNFNGTVPGSNYGTVINCDIASTTNGIYLINQSYDEVNDNQAWRIAYNKIHDIINSSDSHCIGIQGGDNHVIEYNEMYNAGSGVTFWVQPSKIYFNNGSVVAATGDSLTGSSGGSAVVAYAGTFVSSGTWAGRDAAGYIRVNNYVGPWNNGDNIIGSLGARASSTGEVTRQTLQNAIVRYNYVHDMINTYGNGRGIEYSGDHSEDQLVANGQVYGNIVENCTDTAFRIKATTVGNWHFFNNTIYDSKYGLYSLYSNYVSVRNPGFTFGDNVIGSLKSVGYHFYMTQSAVDLSGAIFIGNSYWPDTSGTDNRWRWNNYNQIDYADWVATSSEVGSQLEFPSFLNGSGSYSLADDFYPTWDSPLIDAAATSSIHTSIYTDYAGNPIYGTPDIGAFEYQPPYTISLTDPNASSTIRLYMDGKYRYNLATGSATTLSFSLAPVGGFPVYDASTTRPQYMDLSFGDWSDQVKTWTGTSSMATTTIFYLSELPTGHSYSFKLDGIDNSLAIEDNAFCSSGICTSNGSGDIQLVYIGGFSTHIFSLEDDLGPLRSNGSPSGLLASGTIETSLSLDTDEDANCAYATSSGQNYLDMSALTNTGTTTHQMTLSGLVDGQSYAYYVRCQDSFGNTNDTDYLISFTIASSTPADTDPPLRSNGLPSGTLASSTTETSLSLETDENADCAYATSSGQNYALMTLLTNTGTTTHQMTLSGLVDGQSYAYYIRCQDGLSNANTDDYQISFSVATTTPAPSIPPVIVSGGGSSYQIVNSKPLVLRLDKIGTNINVNWELTKGTYFTGVVLIRTSTPVTADLGLKEIRLYGEEIYQGMADSYEDKFVKENADYYYALSTIDSGSTYSDPLVAKIDGNKVASGTVLVDQSDNSLEGSGDSAEEIELQVETLSGLNNETVEKITRSEADNILANDVFVPLDETEVRLYVNLDIGRYNPPMKDRYSLAYFLHYATPSTKRLGKGEIGGVVYSFTRAYDRFPSTLMDWQDIIKIANGRWPAQSNAVVEENAKTIFTEIYKRQPDLEIATDKAAIMIMAYGLRPNKRDVQIEIKSMKVFEGIFHRHPDSTGDWNVVRAISYSGAKR